MSENIWRVHYNTVTKKPPAQFCYVYPEGYVELHRPRKDSRQLISEKLGKISHKGKIHSFKIDDNSEPEIQTPKYVPSWKTGLLFLF